MRYRTITLWQPYATFIALGLKQYETRSWYPGKRLQPGEIIMIHAAKRKLGSYEKRLLQSPVLLDALEDRNLTLPDIPYGAIVCAARFIDAHSTNVFQPTGIERLLGNYQANRYAWELEVVRVPREPIPATGQQGVWYWESINIEKGS